MPSEFKSQWAHTFYIDDKKGPGVIWRKRNNYKGFYLILCMVKRASTREYVGALKDVYRKKGFLAAAAYDLKSTWHSLGNRLANIVGELDKPDRYRAPGSEEERIRAPAGGRYRNESRSLWESEKEKRETKNREYLLRGKKKTDLETRSAPAIVGILGLFGALFFLSANLTGFAISNLNQTSSNWIGVGLFLVGLIAAFVYFRRR